MKRISLLFIILTFLFGISNAQKRTVDSLQRLLKNANHDTLKFKALNELSWYYYFDKPDSTIFYAKILGERAHNIGYPKYELKALNFLGGAYNNLGENTKAIEYYLKSLIIAEEIKDYGELNLSYNNIGIIYFSEENYDKAIEYYSKGLKVAKQAKHNEGIAISSQNIALVYETQLIYKKAIFYYESALESDKQEREKAMYLNSIARCQSELSEHENAIGNYKKALKIGYTLNDRYIVAYCLGEIGKTYSILKQFDSTNKYCDLKYVYVQKLNDKSYLNSYYMDMYIITKEQKQFEKALSYCYKLIAGEKEISDSINLCETYNNTGELLVSMGLYPKSIVFFDSSLTIAKKINNLPFQEVAYKNLFISNMKLNNTAKALDFHILFKKLNDSILSENNLKQISKDKRNYSAVIKEIELNSSFKEEKNKIKIENNEKDKRQTIIIYSFLFGLIIVSVFAFFIFKSLQKNRQANKVITAQKIEVEEKNHLIEEKQKEIIDSINYAKRIQKAQLPTDKYIDKSLDRLKDKS